MLYITSSWLTYFISGSLYLLIPFTYFTHTPLPHLHSGNDQLVLCIYVSGFMFDLLFF